MAFEFPGDEFAAGDLAKLLAAFHRTHERIYTIKDENDVVEFTTWKLRAIGNTGGAGRRGHAAVQGAAAPDAEIPPPGLSRHRLGHDRDPGL